MTGSPTSDMRSYSGGNSRTLSLREKKGRKVVLTGTVTLSRDGKTRTVYVPLDLLEEVQAWVSEYQRLKSLTGEISQLTLALVQGHVRARRRKRGRP